VVDGTKGNTKEEVYSFDDDDAGVKLNFSGNEEGKEQDLSAHELAEMANKGRALLRHALVDFG
jgi:hypothetical protein